MCGGGESGWWWLWLRGFRVEGKIEVELRERRAEFRSDRWWSRSPGIEVHWAVGWESVGGWELVHTSRFWGWK